MSLVSIVLPVQNQTDHVGEVMGQYRTARAPLPFLHGITLTFRRCNDCFLDSWRKLAFGEETS
jgi:hypothetical protein